MADELIRHNVRRKDKKLFTDNPEGSRVQLTAYPTQRDEADDIAARIAGAIHNDSRRARDFAIFYRTNALSRQIEHSLREHGVPYQIVNGLEFYQRKEIKDILAYLHLLNNPRMMWRCCGSSTRRRAESARRRSTSCATLRG